MEEQNESTENVNTESNESNQTEGGDQTSNEFSSEPKMSRGERRFNHDLMKYKNAAKESQKRESELMAKLQAIEEQSLKEKEDYKGLFERVSAERDQFKQAVDERDQVFLNDKKFQAIERECIKRGIRPEALDDLRHLDHSSVIVETTSEGRYNSLGHAEFAENLKKTRPYWFQTQGAPNVNTGSPNYQAPAKRTMADILKLQTEGKKAEYEKALMEHLKAK
jgi:hypothetical protein